MNERFLGVKDAKWMWEDEAEWKTYRREWKKWRKNFSWVLMMNGYIDRALMMREQV